MSLNLTTSSADFSPMIKYNAKAGRWFVRDDNGNDAEIANPRFALDLANVKTGWLCFTDSGPQAVWDKNGTRAPRPQPVAGRQYKDGFEVHLMGRDPQPALGGRPLGVRQWMSNANAAKAGLIKAYDAYSALVEENKGCVPVFHAAGVVIVKGQNGDSFEPVLSLVSWVERDKVPELTAASQAAYQQPSNGSGSQDAFGRPVDPGYNPPAPAQAYETSDDEIPW